MMRYSEISRDLTTDNLRYSEVSLLLLSPTQPLFILLFDTHTQIGRKPAADYMNYGGQTFVTASPTQTRCQAQVSPQHLRQPKQRNSNGNAHTMACLRQDKGPKELQAEQAQAQQPVSKTLNIKSTRRKNSIGCLTSFSSSPDSPGCYYSIA